MGPMDVVHLAHSGPRGTPPMAAAAAAAAAAMVVVVLWLSWFYGCRGFATGISGSKYSLAVVSLLA